MRIVQQGNGRAAFGSNLTSELDGVVGHIVAFGVGDGEIRAQFGCDIHQRCCNIIAIANIAHVHAFERAEFFLNGKGVGHRLAGMVEIAQAVDDRHRGILSQFFDVLVFEDTRHYHIHIAREHTRYIRNRFTFAQTDFCGGEIKRIAAQMAHHHIKRNARTQARFLEDHRHSFAFADRLIATGKMFSFQFDSQVEHILECFTGVVRNCEKIFHFGFLFSCL